MIGCYCRVSTADQNLDRQLSSTTDYAQDELDAEPDEIEIYRDKSTGTDVEREGYIEMMDDLEAGEIDTVVVHEISRLARSLQDLEETIGQVTDADAEIHFVRDNLEFGTGDENPMNRLQMQMLGAFAEWEARVKRRNTIEGIAARKADDEYHHGPAPMGFEKEDGRLVPNPKYDRVVAILDRVQSGHMSKRKAAKELDVARSTIRTALDRADLYGL